MANVPVAVAVGSVPIVIVHGCAAAMNDYDWHRDYGNANWDIRHRFVTSSIYDMPYFLQSNSFLRWTLGNWQANGIFTAQSGVPFNVIIAPDQANIGRPNQRPNIVGTPSDNCGSGHLIGCINSAAFALPAQFTFGNAGRNILYGPGLVDADFSLIKDFPIKERARFQFRAEVFNIFNHPNLGNPNTTWKTGSFGNITQTVTDNRYIQFGSKFIF